MHQSLIPNVTAAPSPGYTLHQMLPLDQLRAQLIDSSADIHVSRRLFQSGGELSRDDSVLTIRDGEWQDVAGARYTLEAPIDENEWRDGSDIPFIETLVSVKNGAGFRSMFAPGFYTVFDSDRYKTFFNDNALKFANTVVIYQIEAFGKWIEGYPACHVDPAHDIDQSVLLINPHDMPAVVTIELENSGEPRRVRVAAHSARRYGFAAALGDAVPWSGQAFVWGPNRVNLFFVNHGCSDPCAIVTMEHSEVYRGEPAFVPMLEEPMRRLYRWKKRVIDGVVR